MGEKWKGILGSIAAFAVVLLFYAVRKRRTVNNLVETFQESPATAILILVIAIAAAVGITLLRNFIRSRKK